MSHEDIVGLTQAGMFFFEIFIIPAFIWRKDLVKWLKRVVKPTPSAIKEDK